MINTIFLFCGSTNKKYGAFHNGPYHSEISYLSVSIAPNIHFQLDFFPRARMFSKKMMYWTGVFIGLGILAALEAVALLITAIRERRDSKYRMMDNKL